MKKLIKKLNEIENELDLKKKFPGYFNRKILNSMWAFIFIFCILALASNGFKINHYWIENPTDKIIQNPFRTCENQNLYTFDSFSCVDDPPPELVAICGGDCPPYLEPYQIIGEKPNNLYLYFDTIFFLMLISGLIFNHLYYKIRKPRRF